MGRCNNMVSQFVPRGYSYREVKLRCGSTSIHGDVLLCEDCRKAAEKEFPQGWRNCPGDTCRHGTYLGCMEDGDERLCGECEAAAPGEEQ